MRTLPASPPVLPSSPNTCIYARIRSVANVAVVASVVAEHMHICTQTLRCQCGRQCLGRRRTHAYMLACAALPESLPVPLSSPSTCIYSCLRSVTSCSRRTHAYLHACAALPASSPALRSPNACIRARIRSVASVAASAAFAERVHICTHTQRCHRRRQRCGRRTHA